MEENNYRKAAMSRKFSNYFILSRRARHWADIASEFAICMGIKNEQVLFWH